ncbi:MAG: hypothetical protein JWO54_896 [Candidatus Saccharibacteria bacterium]|nr:hypothetical protein [Candidatus Saccharibacteria bacterium]
MDFLIPTSPVAIIIAALLAAFVVLRLVSDYRSIKQSRQLYSQLLEFGKLKSQQSFTVVIELSRKAETIFALLDTIYAQHYPSLQVIVVVKRPAGVAARTKLAAYKRQHKLTGFKVVDHEKNQTIVALAKRHSKGKVVIKLNEDMKISPHFFSDLSLDFVQPGVVAVVPDKVHQLNATVSTALREHFTTISKFKTALWLNKVHSWQLNDGVAFRLKEVAKNFENTTGLMAVTSRSTFITTPSAALKPKALVKQSVEVTKVLLGTKFVLWLSMAAFVALVGLAVLFPAESILISVVLAVLYVLLYASVLSQNNAYKFIDKTNLILLAPFALLYALLIYIATILYVGFLQAKRFAKSFPLASLLPTRR